MSFFVLLFVCSPSLHYLSRTSGRWTILIFFDYSTFSGRPGDIKEISKNCIKQNIVNDWHLLRAAHLLKQVEEYKKQYNRIFIQADREYINFIKAELEKTIDTSGK